MVSGRIRVISERIMSRGYEPAVARLMETVKAKVRAQPGLLSVTTYSQLDDSHKYVVFSEVRLRLRWRLLGVGGWLACQGWSLHSQNTLTNWLGRNVQWRSKKDYDAWVASDEFKECTNKINELLDVPGLHARVFKTPQDDIFLL